MVSYKVWVCLIIIISLKWIGWCVESSRTDKLKYYLFFITISWTITHVLSVALPTHCTEFVFDLELLKHKGSVY